MHSHARVTVPHAARYMTQLAKHWSHRFAVTYDERQAEIPLPGGECRITATAPEVLDIDLDSADAATLERLKVVVAEHLGRFAFRESPLAFDWSAE
jgi:hypothetical protein